MPTNAEIKALIQREVRQQRSHLVRNGLAYILDSIIDNIGAPGGTPGIDDVLAEGQAITADRIINATGFNLTHTADTHTFNVGGQANLSVTLPSSFLRAFDATDNGNESKLTLNTTGDQAEAELSAKFNDGVKEAQIRILTESTTSTITHTSDRHIFVGAVMLPTSNPGVPGAIWNNAGTPAISA